MRKTEEGERGDAGDIRGGEEARGGVKEAGRSGKEAGMGTRNRGEEVRKRNKNLKEQGEVKEWGELKEQGELKKQGELRGEKDRDVEQIIATILAEVKCNCVSREESRGQSNEYYKNRRG